MEKSFRPSICSFTLKLFEFVLDKHYQRGQWDNDPQMFLNFAVTIHMYMEYTNTNIIATAFRPQFHLSTQC